MEERWKRLISNFEVKYASNNTCCGRSKRLRGITSNPKCMLEINGETLIQRQLRLLGKVYSTPVIIVGYKYKAIIEHVGHKEFIMNPIWRQSNTLISLLFAISGPPVDTLVINGDVVFREDLLPKMLEADYSACAVQPVEPTDEKKVKVNASGMIVEIGKYWM